MIQENTAKCERPSWQEAMIQAVTDPAELFSLLKLDSRWLSAAKRAATLFPLRVPRGFIARMRQGDIHDPLLKQILPIVDEEKEIPGFFTDPLQESAANPIPGLLHKYYGRVLLTVASACGVNCRYCFRRHFPYEENNPGIKGWDRALDYINADTTIHEVILSGGDPLIASDYQLANLCKRISKIKHVKTLRIHSRMSIVIPERLSSEFLDWFSALPLRKVFVTHCNHPQEIDNTVKQAHLLLKNNNITLLNQSVLLKGINDDADILFELSEKLFDAGILPYYLHLLDKVQGAAHFDTEINHAREIYQQLSAKLPGYLVPKLVYEKAGARGKVMV